MQIHKYSNGRGDIITELEHRQTTHGHAKSDIQQGRGGRVIMKLAFTQCDVGYTCIALGQKPSQLPDCISAGGTESSHRQRRWCAL